MERLFCLELLLGREKVERLKKAFVVVIGIGAVGSYAGLLLKSDTTLSGIDSLSDLAPGDYVTLEYYTFRDKNRVTEISFDKHEESSEDDASKAKEYAPADLVG